MMRKPPLVKGLSLSLLSLLLALTLAISGTLLVGR